MEVEPWWPPRAEPRPPGITLSAAAQKHLSKLQADLDDADAEALEGIVEVIAEADKLLDQCHEILHKPQNTPEQLRDLLLSKLTLVHIKVNMVHGRAQRLSNEKRDAAAVARGNRSRSRSRARGSAALHAPPEPHRDRHASPTSAPPPSVPPVRETIVPEPNALLPVQEPQRSQCITVESQDSRGCPSGLSTRVDVLD